MEMWGPQYGSRERLSVKGQMSPKPQNHQDEFSAAAWFPRVCHPSAAITNSDPVNMSRQGPLTQTMDVKGSVYQGLGWVGFSRVSMCFCSVFILCICFLYMINNYRTHSSKQTYSLPQAEGNTMKTHA